MESSPDIFLAFGRAGLGAALFVSIAGLFWKMDEAISAQARVALAKRLERLEILREYQHWPFLCASFFDRIYGAAHFTHRCFIGAAATSLLSMVIMVGMWAAIRPIDFLSFLRSSVQADVSVAAVIGLTFSIFPAYISLLKTRKLLNICVNEARASMIVVFAVVDSATSVAILLLFVHVIAFDYDPRVGISSITWTQLYDRLWRGLQLHALRPWEVPLGIYLYASLTTSLWIWTYALAMTIVVSITRIGAWWEFMKWVLPVETHPVRSIGIVGGLLVSCIYCISILLV